MTLTPLVVGDTLYLEIGKCKSYPITATSKGFHFGQTEYRQNVEGRNSVHFSISGEAFDFAEDFEGPRTWGDMHDNEYYAGSHMWDHFWHDVLQQ